jgi:uncharacterized damage-inducible protein DinB
MNPAVAPLAAILDLNTDLLLNCLDGLSEAEVQHRLQGGGNSLAFLIAHLTDTRHFMATRLKRPLPNPLTPLLADARSVDDIRGWPPIDELRAAWRAISDHLAVLLPALTEEELREPNAHRFPIGDATRLGLITFLTQHDSYHVGQAAFLRRQIGKPAMAYTRPAPRSPIAAIKAE